MDVLGTGVVIMVRSQPGGQMEASVVDTWTAAASTVLTQCWSQQAMVCLQRPPTRGLQREDCESGARRWTVDMSDWSAQHWVNGAHCSSSLRSCCPNDASGCLLQVLVQFKSFDAETRSKKMFPLCFCDTFLPGNVGDASKWERESFAETFRRFAGIPFDTFYFAIWVSAPCQG